MEGEFSDDQMVRVLAAERIPSAREQLVAEGRGDYDGSSERTSHIALRIEAHDPAPRAILRRELPSVANAPSSATSDLTLRRMRVGGNHPVDASKLRRIQDFLSAADAAKSNR